MKEVTEWNGKPRWMWCWDGNKNNKMEKYVLWILTEEEMKECRATYPVKCSDGTGYRHCAEIEEEKRPCTREELLEMLKKQGLPMLYCKENGYTYSVIRLNDERITVISVLDSSLTYDYMELCEAFTLLDGTELWVEV